MLRSTTKREARVTWLLEAALAQAQRLTGDATLCRVSMAVYDSGTSMAAAFAQVGEPHAILDRYQWDLRDTPLLAAAARDGQARTIGDLRDYSDPDADYLGALRGAGYLSALTVPMVRGHQISGFVFFHARAAFFFTPDVVTRLTAFIADMPRFLMRELERDL